MIRSVRPAALGFLIATVAWAGFAQAQGASETERAGSPVTGGSPSSPLIAALGHDNVPFEFGPESHPVGFSVELLQHVASALHRPISYEVLDRVDLVNAVASRKVDMVGTPVTVTPEITRRLIFTSGFMWTEYQFATATGRPTVDGISALRGLRIAVSRDTPYARWAQRNTDRDGFSVATFPSNTEALKAVLDGAQDAVLASSAVIRYAATQDNRIVPAYAIVETRTQWALPFRKSDVELRNEVQDALDCMKRDGSLAALSRKWFGVEPGPDDLERVVVPGYGVPAMEGYDPMPHRTRC